MGNERKRYYVLAMDFRDYTFWVREWKLLGVIEVDAECIYLTDLSMRGIKDVTVLHTDRCIGNPGFKDIIDYLEITGAEHRYLESGGYRG